MHVYAAGVTRVTCTEFLERGIEGVLSTHNCARIQQDVARQFGCVGAAFPSSQAAVPVLTATGASMTIRNAPSTGTDSFALVASHMDTNTIVE